MYNGRMSVLLVAVVCLMLPGLSAIADGAPSPDEVTMNVTGSPQPKLPSFVEDQDKDEGPGTVVRVSQSPVRPDRPEQDRPTEDLPTPPQTEPVSTAPRRKCPPRRRR